jgi:aspartyl-tRNA(Asn)/glutamyl-tRNA(Gln) amidotransferase subunit A
MSALTKLTLKAALAGLKAKDFSAVEITKAHIDAIEAARGLNAFVLETPDHALTMAKASDERLARGEGGDLEGAPLGIKDLFCTHGVRSTAARPSRRSRARGRMPRHARSGSRAIRSSEA